MRSKLENEQADDMLDEIIGNVQKSLVVKAKEYVRNDDRMHNFNKGSIKSGISRERVLRGFRLKHDISTDDLLDDMDKGFMPTKEYVMEKYGDIINYNILELMSILDKINKKLKT